MFNPTILLISPVLGFLGYAVEICAFIIALVGIFVWIRKAIHLWKTRHLRQIWGIKNGDHVMVVCSELAEPEGRQNVECREFIYNFKYGDLDAYFEVVVTLLRLFPNIKLELLSSGEAVSRPLDLAQHLILIGGPDYNSMTGRILREGITQFAYKSPYVEEQSETYPDEIVIYDTINDKEYCEATTEKDYGYFERVENPNNPKNKIILLGGCHAIGVTGAAKAFSMFKSEQGEVPHVVFENARKVANMLPKNANFSVLVSVDHMEQTINVPIVIERNVTVRHKEDAKKQS